MPKLFFRDIYLLSMHPLPSLLSDTGSNALSLRTRYYVSESKALSSVGTYTIIKIARSVYSQDVN
jgi:hypothetical protein